LDFRFDGDHWARMVVRPEALLSPRRRFPPRESAGEISLWLTGGTKRKTAKGRLI
jgi:hypothetical protein